MLDTFDSKMQFDHERLDVYTAAGELDGVVVAMARLAPRGHAWLGDQAQRASARVVLNLAEALGRDGADRARMLRISKGSALELDAALTLLSHRGGCGEAARGKARALTLRVVAMLTKLRDRALG
jgi:four helix bundle protein